ncbi:MAG: transglycosylase SLT domain-containing protein, partial [Chloroflexi bacterium]|nr:transglycosylase SLT domain-containing protein [Chloroflexota bacterium]
QQYYADLAKQDSSVAPRAMLLQARAALAAGDSKTAEALVQQLFNEYPNTDQTANAYFALEQIRRSAGDCTGALRALDAFLAASSSDVIGPYAALQRAQCASQLHQWSTELSAATAALGIDGGGPRLTQIEALERAGEADLALGRQQDALDAYNRSLALAGTPAYTAEMLFTTATIARAMGQTSLAGDRFRQIVLEYPKEARGPGALDALVEMGLDDSISPLEAGTVRLDAKQYSAAVVQFDQVDASSPDWGAAQVSRAEALLKLGDEYDARAGLQSVADAGVPDAGGALLRLGQLDERDGDEASAEADYQQMAAVAPERAAEALFHVGFTRFVRGDQQGALAAWQSGVASGPQAPELQAQLEYWLGRALPDGSAEAQDAFKHAAAAAPESYYGLRAQDQVDGSLSAASVPDSAAWLAAGPSEVQERDNWLAAQNLTARQVTSDVNALPAMRRAATLLNLGLATEAGWEVDGVVGQYAQTKDVAHMSAVADWTTAHDLPELTLKIGKQMRDLVALEGMPRALQKQVYPAGWGDIVAQQATAYHIDPLLMLAVIRQESAFDPRAQSGAQARGLTQVVPTTARNIASHVGDPDFELEDLFKPSVSVEFGSYYLSQLLGEFKGEVFPTLAAYDAGGGNVNTWIRHYGDDPDLLVEQIPFEETQMYLRVVYENYWHYERLWRNS